MIKIKSFRLYVRAIIIDNLNRVLLIRKNENQKIASGEWIFPGGSVELGEPIESALSRELYEETNLEVDQLRLIGTRTIIIDEIHWQGLYFKVEIKNLDDLKNMESEKHSDLKWWSLDQLPESLDVSEKKFIS